ncbi:MAG: alpha/beta hydrolase [bacterium]|nr:alpha/beta hydrolase [bacterium]
MKSIVGILLLGVILISCQKLKLDSLAFPAVQLDAYEFENYEGEQEIDIPQNLVVTAPNYELVTMSSYDAVNDETHTIYGAYLGDMSTIASDTIILYFHGQSKHMDAYWDRTSLLANLGGMHNYGVFTIDYRGYGMSQGTSTEQGLYEDADAAIDWLIAHGADPSKTFCYGFSLGAIPTIDRAAYRTDFPFAKIMIEAPLATVQNLVNSSTLGMSSGFVTTLEFPNSEKIKDVTAPLLWMHGIEDAYIAIDNGELIYANHGGTEKAAIRVPDCDHSQVPIKMGYYNYMDQVLEFIRE